MTAEPTTPATIVRPPPPEPPEPRMSRETLEIVASTGGILTVILVLASLATCGAGCMAAFCLDGEACIREHEQKALVGLCVFAVAVVGRIAAARARRETEVDIDGHADRSA